MEVGQFYSPAASSIALQFYSASPSDIRFASFAANKITLKPLGFNITIAEGDNITPTKSEYN